MKRIIYTLAFILAALTSQSQTSDLETKISVNIFGDTIVTNQHGKVISSISHDAFGRRIVKNGDGQIVSVYRKDIFGNTVI